MSVLVTQPLCLGTGFWIHTRQRVKPMSYSTGRYNSIAPFQTPLGRCDGNRAHSVWNGFRIDSVEFDNGDVPPQDNGAAVSLGYEPSATTVISNFLVHHARQGGWFRIFVIVLDGWLVGDCREGIHVEYIVDIQSVDLPPILLDFSYS